ncbi:hypothetical protein BV25DRAFT_1825131 [Artomyces pyxidatus]|uniref:Uncharacterized protein n=1 Tax=Artomyces pyxidatus TaxID=48021 RepID=A0ACB8T1G9_9AGAM|nr:hypothetical protein BV25DRAFT_1825131 [Artomyces pyxidatus]
MDPRENGRPSRAVAIIFFQSITPLAAALANNAIFGRPIIVRMASHVPQGGRRRAGE